MYLPAMLTDGDINKVMAEAAQERGVNSLEYRLAEEVKRLRLLLGIEQRRAAYAEQHNQDVGDRYAAAVTTVETLLGVAERPLEDFTPERSVAAWNHAKGIQAALDAIKAVGQKT